MKDDEIKKVVGRRYEKERTKIEVDAQNECRAAQELPAGGARDTKICDAKIKKIRRLVDARIDIWFTTFEEEQGIVYDEDYEYIYEDIEKIINTYTDTIKRNRKDRERRKGIVGSEKRFCKNIDERKRGLICHAKREMQEKRRQLEIKRKSEEKELKRDRALVRYGVALGALLTIIGFILGFIYLYIQK